MCACPYTYVFCLSPCSLVEVLWKIAADLFTPGPSFQSHTTSTIPEKTMQLLVQQDKVEGPFTQIFNCLQVLIHKPHGQTTLFFRLEARNVPFRKIKWQSESRRSRKKTYIILIYLYITLKILPQKYMVLWFYCPGKRLAKNTSLQQKIGDSQSFSFPLLFHITTPPFHPLRHMLGVCGDILILATDTMWAKLPTNLFLCVLFVFWVVGLFVLVGLLVCVFCCFSWKFSLPSFLCLLTCCLLSSILSSFLANRPKGKEQEQSTRELQEHKTGGQTLCWFR